MTGTAFNRHRFIDPSQLRIGGFAGVCGDPLPLRSQLCRNPRPIPGFGTKALPATAEELAADIANEITALESA